MSFRPPVPTPDRHVRWPVDFGQRFTIFVDTEEEFDWSRPLDRDNRSVSATAAIPVATRRFADLGAPLTFLVDHPVATDPQSIAAIGAALAGGTEAAVGSQLHPWVNPPFEEAVTPANSYPGNLPDELEAAKLDALGAAITTAFGITPRIYRAGRYGIGPNTLRLLAARGYAIDTSMRARFDYSRQSGPDFLAIGNDAFVGDHGIVELPLTTVDTGLLRVMGRPLHRAASRVPRGLGGLARTGLLNRVPLTPEGIPVGEALEAIRVAVGNGLPLLNFSFHSPTLVAGHTPYVRDAAGVAAFWTWWDAVLGLLARLGVRSVDAEDLVTAVTGR
ncbi:WalW protein [Sphingomonas sp. Leaf33]|uniref:hypothetical protein n=1 Tax=Sphingomonas sp. Leaf33 TaxID=1736215 RepID=UPI0006F45021|nr:hypothetical protein [Sphingomonas sp. Leaf33]KQN26378.1 WalW protein [Sphingomonas sp. Leaf33]